MPLLLSDAEQTQFAETVRVLLSPLDTPLDQWRAEVLRHLTGLLRTEMGGFILPSEEAPPCTLHNLPDEFAREYFETFQPADRGISVIQRMDSQVWSTRMLAQVANLSIEDGWFRSPEYREFYSRYRIQEGIGFVVPAADPPQLPGGQKLAPGGAPVGAVLTCFHDVFGTEQLGERGLAMVRLLLPALEAGVSGRVRLAWVQNTLQGAFDIVRDGLLVCDADGRRLHANAALTRLLQSDPQSERIAAAIERVASTLCALLRMPRKSEPAPEVEVASTEVRTDRARYRVRGNLVEGGRYGAEPAILIDVERLTPELPSLVQLRERWGLSRQEARVALLVVQGMTNAQAATELELSPATVRHYTESLFHKLDVHSRAEAAHRIMLE
jgi:DNA-binding CsgD family transcriptional regulator